MTLYFQRLGKEWVENVGCVLGKLINVFPGEEKMATCFQVAIQIVDNPLIELMRGLFLFV
jgi:hypothetical protein